MAEKKKDNNFSLKNCVSFQRHQMRGETNFHFFKWTVSNDFYLFFIWSKNLFCEQAKTQTTHYTNTQPTGEEHADRHCPDIVTVPTVLWTTWTVDTVSGVVIDYEFTVSAW